MNDDELRALVAKATPGLWRVWDFYPSHICVDHTKCGTVSVCQVSLNTYHDESRHNRDLIVAAVNALPALLDRLAAAEMDAERYRWLRPHFRTFSLDMSGQHRYCVDSNIGRIRGPSIDAAIDAAREGEK